MAKYEITYKCGHTATVQLLGSIEERQRKIEWYKHNCMCDECRAKQAQEASVQVGLPAIDGSDKQVAWATDIRNKAIDSVRALKVRFDALANTQMPAPQQEIYNKLLIAYNDVANQVSSCSQSRWFIDNRANLENEKALLTYLNSK